VTSPDHLLPPLRTLPAGLLGARAQHLLDETRMRQQGRWRPGVRSVAATVLVLAAIAAAPALAFSTTVRQLVGIEARNARAPHLQATVTGVSVHNRPVGAVATVTFTVGELGKHAGVGIPAGSVFLVLFIPRRGGSTHLIQATGANGHYSVTGWVPRGGLRGVWIGGWLNRLPMPTAAGGFWLPVTVVDIPH
jgi:hypothetical protein